MNVKTVSLLLVCLVVLSILYAYSRTALAQHASQPMNVAPSKLLTITEEASQKVNQPIVQLVPLGDSIDDPIPHKH